MIVNSCKPWYHGSPFALTSLLTGSTITQDRDLARIFSHKPALVSQDTDDEGKRILKHTGSQLGFLYRIAEVVKPDDIYPHPQTTMGPDQEWLTTTPVARGITLFYSGCNGGIVDSDRNRSAASNDPITPHTVDCVYRHPPFGL